MKVVCINNDGMSEHLTLGMVYRLVCIIEDQCLLDNVDNVHGKFDRSRFVIVDLEHDAGLLVGTVISLREARKYGAWPGAFRAKNCPCDIPPGVHCEYHGP
jgi:hypothetical protein